MKITYNIYEITGTTPIYTALHGYQIKELLESIPDDVVISIADASSNSLEALFTELFPNGISKDKYQIWEDIAKDFRNIIMKHILIEGE